MDHSGEYLQRELGRHGLRRPYIRLESDEAMVAIARQQASACFWSLAFDFTGLVCAGVAEEELGGAGLNAARKWALWGQVPPRSQVRLIVGGKGGRPELRQRGRMWVALINAAEPRYATVESYTVEGARTMRSPRIPLRGLS